jgi:MSHA biogenesis protein MshM
MYRAHFGLREPPFGLTPDTSFFFACSAYQEALNTLLIAVNNGEGFLKITGEVGTGKTLLCRKFLSSLNSGGAPQVGAGTAAEEDGLVYADLRGKRFVTAYVPNPYLEPRSLLAALAEELGVTVDKDADLHHVTKALTRALLGFARQDKRVVVCLDEAQAMPVESLEALRLLTNLETEKRKLLQVILFGQPELEHKLNDQPVRQLKQRITFQYHLRGLAKEDMQDYLEHRLKVAGHLDGRVFDKVAVATMYRVTGGIPRLVNIVAHKALMLAYGEGKQEATSRHVALAAADTPAAKPRTQFWRWLGWGAAVVSVGCVSWILL